MTYLDPNKKQKKSWGGLGTVIIIVVAIIAAWYVLRPLGQEVHDVFQRVTNAFDR